MKNKIQYFIGLMIFIVANFEIGFAMMYPESYRNLRVYNYAIANKNQKGGNQKI